MAKWFILKNKTVFPTTTTKLLSIKIKIRVLQTISFHYDPKNPVFSLFPSFSLPDVLCDPNDLISRIGAPFEAMAACTAPSSDGLLAEVFWGFPQL